MILTSLGSFRGRPRIEKREITFGGENVMFYSLKKAKVRAGSGIV